MGEVKIRSDNVNFYFEFSNDSDRQKVLEADTMFIKRKMFIITTWNPSFATAQTQVKSVPIWVHFYKIPLLTWTLVGINWLACHLGRLICFNETTEKLTHLEYAKCLIEISPDKDLPDYIAVGDNESEQVFVRLEYDWKPLICTSCCLFGHATQNCDFMKLTKHCADPFPQLLELAPLIYDSSSARLPTSLHAPTLHNGLSTLITALPKPKTKVWQRKFTPVQQTSPLTGLLPIPELFPNSMHLCTAAMKTSMHRDSVLASIPTHTNQFDLLQSPQVGELVPTINNHDDSSAKAYHSTTNLDHKVTALSSSLASTVSCDNQIIQCSATMQLPQPAFHPPPLQQAPGPSSVSLSTIELTSVLDIEASKQSTLQQLVQDLDQHQSFAYAAPSNQGPTPNDNAYSNLQSYLQNSLPHDQGSLVVFDPPPTTVLPCIDKAESPYSHIGLPPHLASLLNQHGPVNKTSGSTSPKALKQPPRNNKNKKKNKEKMLAWADNLSSGDDLDDGMEYSIDQIAPFQKRKPDNMSISTRTTRLSASKNKRF